MAFSLHPQLEADCISVCDLPICRVLLMNNSNFPWLILVPRIEAMKELFDLGETEYKTVMDEVRMTAERMGTMTKADKMNVAALGNVTPQLHIHVIARFKDDAAWPMPVWNSRSPATLYTPEALEGFVARLRALLA